MDGIKNSNDRGNGRSSINDSVFTRCGSFINKNPILFWLVFIFALFNVIDSFTALFILPGESNPIYIAIGSIWPLIIFKLAISVGAFLIYSNSKFKSNGAYYNFLTILFLADILLALGFASNIYGMLHPAMVAQSATLSTEVKVTYYVKLISFVYMIPLFVNMITFYLYEKSIKKVVLSKPKTWKEEINAALNWFMGWKK